MLNVQRYNSIKQLFTTYKIVLPESDICLYADMFEIISQFIHGKLTDQELFSSFAVLGRLIRGKEPSYAIHVEKKDRLRVQMRVMEELPETKGKLDEEEKLWFAFCVYLATCIRVYDEESDEIKSALIQFTSKENIEQEFIFERERNPELFAVSAPKERVNAAAPFAYSVENPICTISIPGSYRYLNSLRYRGKPVKYERIGSFDGLNHIVDGYILYIKPNLFSKVEERIIYIDAYSSTISSKPPEGFTLAE